MIYCMQSDVDIKLKRFQKFKHDLKLLLRSQLNCSPEATSYTHHVLTINTDLQLGGKERRAYLQ